MTNFHTWISLPGSLVVGALTYISVEDTPFVAIFDKVCIKQIYTYSTWRWVCITLDLRLPEMPMQNQIDKMYVESIGKAQKI